MRTRAHRAFDGLCVSFNHSIRYVVVIVIAFELGVVGEKRSILQSKCRPAAPLQKRLDELAAAVGDEERLIAVVDP